MSRIEHTYPKQLTDLGLTQHGEAILNEANGSVEANQRVRVAFLDEIEMQRRLKLLADLAAEGGLTRRPVIFEGVMAVPFDQIDQRSWYAEIREQGGRLSLRLCRLARRP